MPKRTIFFMIAIGLFGVGLGFTVSMLDPLIYTEKVRQLAPPTFKNTVLSFITIMALLVALIAQPLVGHWSDRARSRWGQRAPFLVSGVIGLSFSLLLIGFAENLWLLVIAAMLTSAFSNTVQGSWQALIPDQLPEEQHGTAAGIKTLLELIGVVGGVTLAGVTLARGNVWAAPLTAGALFWLILPITLYALWWAGATNARRTETSKVSVPTTDEIPAAPLTPPEQNQLDPTEIKCSSPTSSQTSLRFPNETSNLSPAWLTSLMGETGFFWWIVNRLLFWSSGIAIRTFILNYMEDALLLSLAEIQALSNKLFLILGIGIFLLVLPAGIMADRLGRRPLLMAAGLLASSGTALLIFARGPNLLFIAAGLIACGSGIFASASWALATDLAPQTKGALYLGIANGATVIGSISGRLGGPVIDGLNQFFQTNSLGYIVVFTIAALFFAGSSLVVLKIPKHRRL